MRALTLTCLSGMALFAADPALTIYNQNFAVIRNTVPLKLQKGENHITYSEITAHLEPQSVILRDVTGRVRLRVLEQNYRADPVSDAMLLARFEGQTIEFLVPHGDRTEIVRGKVVRSGYSPMVYSNNGYQQLPPSSPIIEVDGKLRFSLPGQPLFPALGDDTILKPTINWTVASDRDARVEAELAYVSRGMTWSADYNVIAAPGRADVDVIGWVSMHNDTGKAFENAHIKLMAGEVNKVEPPVTFSRAETMGGVGGGFYNGPPVTEKTFDEYHLYTLERPATLHDKETKQVEFIRAGNVASQAIYVYDGMKLDLNQYRGWNMDMIRNNPEYGSASNNKVWVMQEFKNSQANHLGMPLPAGRVRFYRQDTDGQLEFTGENQIQHTPKDETVRLFTGSAFDLTGERKRINFQIDMNRREINESFEIKLRNHKKQAVEIRVVEHLYRGLTWEIQQPSVPFVKTDSQTIEYRLTLAPDAEKSVNYNAYYRW
jgi:hypothetical protein